jgi:uncharacterized protein YjbI with pentapeptide repeats
MMAEEFEGRDLSDAVFWGVDLRRATFRDVNLSLWFNLPGSLV